MGRIDGARGSTVLTISKIVNSGDVIGDVVEMRQASRPRPYSIRGNTRKPHQGFLIGVAHTGPTRHPQKLLPPVNSSHSTILLLPANKSPPPIFTMADNDAQVSPSNPWIWSCEFRQRKIQRPLNRDSY